VACPAAWPRASTASRLDAQECFAVEEQFGRSTKALSWHVPTAYNVLAHGSGEQIERC
jgi:hypothetical protein